jgi:hypothetical protein
MLDAFCLEKAFTATGYSTDSVANAGQGDHGYIDLGATDAFAASSNTGTEYFGVGEPIAVEAIVTTLMDDAHTPRTGTCVVTIETADDTAFTSNLTTLLTLYAQGSSTVTFAAGSAAGTRVQGRLPLGALYRRYLRAKFTMGATLSGGKFSCYLAKDLQNNYNYPGRITVD